MKIQLITLFLLITSVIYAQQNTAESLTLIPYANKGIYGTFSVQAGGSKVFDKEFNISSGIDGKIGYAFSNQLMFGVGAGVHAITGEIGEYVYPITGEWRSIWHINDSPLGISLGVEAGYAFASINENKRILFAEGGWVYHPSVGITLSRKAGKAIFFDVGYRFQPYEVERRTDIQLNRSFFGTPSVPDSNATTEHRTYQMKRLTARMGILF